MSQERTEQPTFRRLRETRKRGEAAVSRELTGAVALIVFLLVVRWFGPILTDRLIILTRVALAATTQIVGHETGILAVLRDSVMPVLTGVLCLILVPAAAGCLATFIQTGPIFSGHPLLPQLKKLNPLEGMKRVFLSARACFEVIATLAKLAAVIVVCWFVVRSYLPEILRCSLLPPLESARLAGRVLEQLAWSTAITLLGLAVVDLLYRRWQFLRDHRMTKEEVRKEYEDDEGKPEIRQERQRAHRELATEAMLQEVHDADVVVVNPTHIACALRFDPQRENAPRLLAKGKGVIAERIREIARREGVCMTQNIPLARTLYTLELRVLIPPELYEAVKHILLWVEEVTRTQGRSPRWTPPEVPAESAVDTQRQAATPR